MLLFQVESDPPGQAGFQALSAGWWRCIAGSKPASSSARVGFFAEVTVTTPSQLLNVSVSPSRIPRSRRNSTGIVTRPLRAIRTTRSSASAISASLHRRAPQ